MNKNNFFFINITVTVFFDLFKYFNKLQYSMNNVKKFSIRL